MKKYEINSGSDLFGFLGLLVGKPEGWIRIIIMPPDPNDSSKKGKPKVYKNIDLSKPDEALVICNEVYGKPNLYFTPNSFREAAKGNRIGGADDLLQANCMAFDLDVPKVGNAKAYPTRSELRSVLKDFDLWCVIESDTDGGLYVLFRIAEPTKDIDKLTQLGKAVWDVLSCGLAPNTIDTWSGPHRFIRLPGSTRESGGQCKALAMSKDPCATLEAMVETYSVEDVPERVYEKRQDENKPITQWLREQGIGIRELLLKHEWRVDGNDDCWRPGASSGSRSGVLWELETGELGITIKSGGCSPLEQGKWYSVESAFVMLEFGGDWDRAATSCRSQSDPMNDFGVVEDEPVENDLEDAGPPVRPVIDTSLYSCPGFIEDAMQYTLDTATYPSIPLAFAGAIVLLSTIIARLYRFNGLMPNLYVVALANTGDGKNAPRQANKELMRQAGLERHVVDNLASGQGFEDFMMRDDQEPIMLAQIDEFDKVIKAIVFDNDGKLGSLVGNLLIYYTDSNSFTTRRVLADGQTKRKGNTTATLPHVTIFATCTPTLWYETIDQSMLVSGLIPRMLVVENGPRGKSKDRVKPTITAGMQELFDECRAARAGRAFTHDKPIEVNATNDARDILLDFRNACDVQADSKASDSHKGIWTRANELAIKLALLHAASAYDKPFLIVEANDARWAVALATQVVSQAERACRENIAENKIDRDRKRVVGLIRKHGSITHSELLRNLSSMTAANIKEHLGYLIESGMIIRKETKSKAGPNRTSYSVSQGQ